NEQLIPDLDNESMIAGDPRIINHNVILWSTANKPDISILEPVLSYGDIMVFQFKSKHVFAPWFATSQKENVFGKTHIL
ncbi:MAG: hypothetical protein PVG64_01615, partial [Syntrophobacterales bacterium]